MILHAVAYDPDADEGQKRSSHFTKKELRIYAIAFVVAVFLFIPVYHYLLDLRNSHVCTQNLRDIGSAMEAYASDNNDRYPPLYQASETGYEPAVYKGNEVLSWVSLLSRYAKSPKSFNCPASEETEQVQNIPGDVGPAVPSSYGMYAPLSTVARGTLSSLASSALIVDSSNDAGNGTYDPLPFKDKEGKPVPDGIVIGLDTSNFYTPDDSSPKVLNAANFPTRVALPGSGRQPLFGPETRTRHPDGINLLMADLHWRRFPLAAFPVQHSGNKKNNAIVGLWQLP